MKMKKNRGQCPRQQWVWHDPGGTTPPRARQQWGNCRSRFWLDESTVGVRGRLCSPRVALLPSKVMLSWVAVCSTGSWIFYQIQLQMTNIICGLYLLVLVLNVAFSPNRFNSDVTNARVTKTWEEITKLLAASFPDRAFERNAIQKKWWALKKRGRQEIQEFRRESTKTGKLFPILFRQHFHQ